MCYLSTKQNKTKQKPRRILWYLKKRSNRHTRLKFCVPLVEYG